MRILFIINSLSSGGAERVTTALASYLLGRGHDVTVATLAGRENDFYLPDARIRRLAFGLAGESIGVGKLVANLRRLHALRRAIRHEQAQVVIGMMTTSAVLAILASAGLPTRVIASERNYPGMKGARSGWNMLRRLVYRFADAHVAQTQKGADWIEQHTGARNIHVIPNSVAWPVPSCPPVVQPDTVVPSGRRMVLAVGTKIEQKGFDLLLEAYGRIALKLPEWDLVILGVEQAGQGAQLQAQLRAAGLGERVHLPGRVGNVGEWYERADLFVLSSRYEGFPNVLLEAMAAGCACVAFDCDTGPRDIIEPGVDGMLVPAEDTTALAAAMERLMTNDALRAQLGYAALSVRERFAEERVLARWESVIQQLA